MNRILQLNSKKDIITELTKIGVSSQGVRAMYKKAFSRIIKLRNVKIGAANIIKQDMLSIGGDAAVARGVVNGQIERSDLIILGNENQIQKLIEKLSHQDIFEIPKLRQDVKRLLEQENSTKTNFLYAKGYKLPLNRTLIMGIANLSPDSFYDGGNYNKPDKALFHIEEMVQNGADIIDIGGESTRPFSEKVNAETELERILPILEKVLRNFDIPISIDTYKSSVAKAALQAGAHIINDISGLNFDEKMAPIIAQYGVPVIIMHMQGTPQDMQKHPTYTDVIEEISDYLQKSIYKAENAGINSDNIIIDPGIGFGKTVQHNLDIIKRISEFKCFGKPILLGTSNKSFIGKILETENSDRLAGTIATNGYGILNGVNILRVHEVKENKQMSVILDSMRKS